MAIGNMYLSEPSLAISVHIYEAAVGSVSISRQLEMDLRADTAYSVLLQI